MKTKQKQNENIKKNQSKKHKLIFFYLQYDNVVFQRRRQTKSLYHGRYTIKMQVPLSPRTEWKDTQNGGTYQGIQIR